MAVFDIQSKCLQDLQKNLHAPQSKLIEMQHANSLQKFIDLCARINIDPLHPFAIHTAVMAMCKCKNNKKIVNFFGAAVGDEKLSSNLEIDNECQVSYTKVFSAMSDWLLLFQFLHLVWNQDHQMLSDVPSFCRANEQSYKQMTSAENIRALRTELERNTIIMRLQTAMKTAQVVSDKYTLLDTALYAFLYLAPCSTPSGKMLEHLYCKTNSNAVDAEIRCLRAMTLYKDAIDDETLYMQTFALVMRCFLCKDNFFRAMELLLRKNNEAKKIVTVTSCQPLLKNYAQNAVQNKHLMQASNSWTQWKIDINFPLTVSTFMQKLLYFISCQQIAPSERKFVHYYQADVMKRAREYKITVIDVECILSVIKSLRSYNGQIETLIDFRAKCQLGLNSKLLKDMSLSTITQLYIVTFQHESIVEILWKNIVPMYNQTIISALKDFRKKHKFEIDSVLDNLMLSMLN